MFAIGFLALETSNSNNSILLRQSSSVSQMKRPSRARKATPMNEVSPVEAVVYSVEFLPLRYKSTIVAQSFLFFQGKLKIFFSFQMLATNLRNNSVPLCRENSQVSSWDLQPSPVGFSPGFKNKIKNLEREKRKSHLEALKMCLSLPPPMAVLM